MQHHSAKCYIHLSISRFDVEKECERLDGNNVKDDQLVIVNTEYQVKTQVDTFCNALCLFYGYWQTISIVYLWGICCMCKMCGLYNTPSADTTGEARPGKPWKGQRQRCFQSKRLQGSSSILFQVRLLKHWLKKKHFASLEGHYIFQPGILFYYPRCVSLKSDSIPIYRLPLNVSPLTSL